MPRPASHPASAHQGRTRARRVALQALYQWQMTGMEPSELRAQFAEGDDLKGADVDYFGELVSGVTADSGFVDGELATCMQRPLAEVDPVELGLLRLGTWELARRPEVPYRVVINECVNLAKKFGATDAHTFVNAVLDCIARRHRPVEAGASSSPG